MAKRWRKVARKDCFVSARGGTFFDLEASDPELWASTRQHCLKQGYFAVDDKS